MYDSDSRKQSVEELLDDIQRNRDIQHGFRNHTWSSVSIDPGVSETLAALVFGVKGHGFRGQQKGNKGEGQLYRGDFVSEWMGDWDKDTEYTARIASKGKAARFDVVHHEGVIYQCVNSNTGQEPSSGNTDYWIKLESGKEAILLPKECKTADKVCPNIDFILKGRAITLSPGKQNPRAIIELSDDIDENTLEQIDYQKDGIHKAIQSASSSIQFLEQKKGQYFGLNIFGKTQGSPLLRTKNGALYKWNKGGKGEPASYVETSWNYLGKPYFVDLCRKKGLRISGNIDELIARLEEKNIEYKLKDNAMFILMQKAWKLPENYENQQFAFVMRQDDGHYNFGPTTKEKMDTMLGEGFTLVHHHYDRLGRVAVAFFLLKPDLETKERILQAWDEKESIQPNLRLFEDCIRTEYYSSDKWGLASLGAKLVAYAVQQPDGFRILHWGSELDLESDEAKSYLIGLPDDLEEMPIEPSGFDLDWECDEARMKKAEEFFNEAIVGFYRDMNKFTKMTNTAKNIGFGLIAEHMDCLVLKLRGCRSRARGKADAWNESGEICEIKTQVGCSGDAMGTQHKKGTIHLGNPENVDWKGGLIINLIADRKSTQHNLGDSDKDLFCFRILGPKSNGHNTMETLYDHAERYAKHEHKSKPDLQYRPVNEYDSTEIEIYWGKKSECQNEGKLEFSIVAEFIEGLGLVYQQKR